MDKFETLIDRLAQSVADDYEEARNFARARNAQRAGHEGESTWVRFLTAWGPGWPVVSRKYIVGPGGATNEVDVLLLKPDYPHLLRDEASVLASGVAAAFTVKTTLRRSDIEEALAQKRLLLEVAGPSEGSAREVLVGPIRYGVLAHGIDTPGPKEVQAARLVSWYEGLTWPEASSATTHPREELDGILVAEACFLSTMRTTLAPRGGSSQPLSSLMRHPDLEAAGAPLAQFIVWLNAKFADPERGAALAGLGVRYAASEASGTMRWWDTSIFPERFLANRGTLLNPYGYGLNF